MKSDTASGGRPMARWWCLHVSVAFVIVPVKCNIYRTNWVRERRVCTYVNVWWNLTLNMSECAFICYTCIMCITTNDWVILKYNIMYMCMWMDVSVCVFAYPTYISLVFLPCDLCKVQRESEVCGIEGVWGVKSHWNSSDMMFRVWLHLQCCISICL